MLQGTVRRFNKDKGYGFITPDNAPKEDLLSTIQRSKNQVTRS